MESDARLYRYLTEIRAQVCRRCIERPPDAPPCAPKGKRCGIELHLQEIVDITHATVGRAIDPYMERFHEEVCSECANRATDQCPCPLDYLLLLAVEAIEATDRRLLDSELATSN